MSASPKAGGRAAADPYLVSGLLILLEHGSFHTDTGGAANTTVFATDAAGRGHRRLTNNVGPKKSSQTFSFNALNMTKLLRAPLSSSLRSWHLARHLSANLMITLEAVKGTCVAAATNGGEEERRPAMHALSPSLPSSLSPLGYKLIKAANLSQHRGSRRRRRGVGGGAGRGEPYQPTGSRDRVNLTIF